MRITARQISRSSLSQPLGHFARAAEKMHRMQRGLSQQIRDLETEPGIRLFDRTTRPVGLTEGGAVWRATLQRHA